MGIAMTMTSGCIGSSCTCNGIDLWDAVQSGDHDAIQAYADAGGDLDCPSTTGGTALTFCVMNQNLEVYRQLLALGADPDAAGGSESGVVCRAAAMDAPGWLELALKHGGNPNSVSTGGVELREDVAINIATYEGHLSQVQLLVEHGANIDARGYNGHTALTMAAVKSHFDIALFLLESGADQSIRSGNRLTFRQYMRGKSPDKFENPQQKASCEQVWEFLSKGE
ncbi:MAG: ankyrin repeat domain-containing protein [Planctomycetaceae bacterium]|nr:ankyrin repeat domain-containing protein [Planctomycetaceae bacterium]